jgi:hypothetical protein
MGFVALILCCFGLCWTVNDERYSASALSLQDRSRSVHTFRFVGIDDKSLQMCRDEITNLVEQYPTLSSFLKPFENKKLTS